MILSLISLIFTKDNQIEKLEQNLFDALVNLEFLYVDGNNLSELLSAVINPLATLRVLNASNNKINYMDWDNFTTYSLVTLDLHYNELAEISLCTDSTSNTTLCPDFNGPYGPLSLLIFLDLSFNKLVSINKYDFYLFPLLQVLNINNNQIYFMDPMSFSLNLNLKTLDLSHNFLTTFDSSPFVPLNREAKPSIENLTLSYNKIESITDDSFLILSNLKLLDLSSNYLLDLGLAFNGLTRLQYLYLTANLITSVDVNAFVGLDSIVVLNLELNQIQKFSATALDVLIKSEFVLQVCLFENPVLYNDPGFFASYTAACSSENCALHTYEPCLANKFLF